MQNGLIAFLLFTLNANALVWFSPNDSHHSSWFQKAPEKDYIEKYCVCADWGPLGRIDKGGSTLSFHAEPCRVYSCPKIVTFEELNKMPLKPDPNYQTLCDLYSPYQFTRGMCFRCLRGEALVGDDCKKFKFKKVRRK